MTFVIWALEDARNVDIDVFKERRETLYFSFFLHNNNIYMKIQNNRNCSIINPVA